MFSIGLTNASLYTFTQYRHTLIPIHPHPCTPSAQYTLIPVHPQHSTPHLNHLRPSTPQSIIPHLITLIPVHPTAVHPQSSICRLYLTADFTPPQYTLHFSTTAHHSKIK